MSDPFAFQYRAFISHSHADARWAKWLHRWLEAFRGNEDLMGRDATGAIHKTLRPIFRHDDDFTGSHSLALTALDASHALIIICSPASAKNHNVSEAIRLFKLRHPERPIIPLIVEGKAGDPKYECFPPSLKFKLDGEGTITDVPIDLLAADAREEGDGKDLALAKVVGALLGVSSDEVFRGSERGFRGAKRERRRLAGNARIKGGITVGIKGAIAAAFVFLIALASAFAYFDHQRRQHLLAIDTLVAKYGTIDSVRAPAPEPNVSDAIASIAKGAAREPRYETALQLLKAGKYKETEPILEAVAEDKKKLPGMDNKEMAEAFRNLASIVAISDHGKARNYYAEAAALDPDHVEGMFWNGWFKAEAGSLSEAETAYRRVVSTATRGQDDWVLYWAHLGIGDIRISRGDLSAAAAEYQAASEMAERLTYGDPDVDSWQGDLRVAYIKVGDVLMAQGNLAEALKSYRRALTVTERLATSAPDNVGLQRDLVASYGRAGSVLAQQGEATLARDTFNRGRAIAAQLTKRFPDDVQLPNQLTAFDAEIAKLK
jgi:tetratricopeptide (TPR) repeat protein